MDIFPLIERRRLFSQRELLASALSIERNKPKASVAPNAKFFKKNGVLRDGYRRGLR
jgi:hypothetical protein